MNAAGSHRLDFVGEPDPHLPRDRTRAHRGALLGVFLLGLAVSLLLLARGQVGGDQLNLLSHGWLLTQGQVIHWGNPLSSSGYSPGSVTSLLVGLPLMLWQDFRAPVVVVLLFHLVAYALLDRVAAAALPPRARVYLAVFYWLNPWRLYLSGFLWNPNWLFLFGALHLATAWRLRREASFWATLVHVLGLGVAAQLHPSTLLLIVASGLLWWRRVIHVSWPAVMTGCTLTLASLIPWWLTLADQPPIPDEGKGFLLRGLILVFPLIRGLLYWLRYVTPEVSHAWNSFHFGDVLAPGPDHLARALLTPLGQFVAPLLVALPVLANLRLWGWRWPRPRRGRRNVARWLPRRRGAGLGVGWRRPAAVPRNGRNWLAGYLRLCFVAAVIVFALAPTTIMPWQATVLFHAPVLVVVLWLTDRARLPGPRRRVRQLAVAWGVFAVVLSVAAAFGGLHYRCAGHTGADSFGFALAHDSPMFEQLGIQDACPWPMNVPTSTWWPDMLPAE